MKRILGLATVGMLWAGAVGAQACPPGPTALVLSGGGVKGLAHIGVIRVLDSLGVRPDMIIGSSMGAVVGALYAGGLDGTALDALARRLPVVSLFQRYDLQGPIVMERRAPVLVWEEGKRGLALRNATVDQTEINLLLSAALLGGNLRAGGDFDSLRVAFRPVATELEHGTPMVFSSGDLAQTVRASMAIPLVFDPVEIDGTFYLDGGLSQNIPVAAARAMGARRVIVSDVTAPPPSPLNPFSAFDVGEQMLNYLFTQPADSMWEHDVRIRTELPDVQSLDFSRPTVAHILDRGYRVADSTLRGVACLGGGTAPRESPPQSVLRVARVAVTPGSDSAVVVGALGLTDEPSLTTSALATRLRRLAETRWFRALWLHPRGPTDSLTLEVVVHAAPRRVAGVGAAYHSDLGGQIWGAVLDRRVLGTGLEGSLMVSFDRFRQEGFASLRRHVRDGAVPGSPTVSVAIANEDVRRFAAAGPELPPVDVQELSAVLGLERTLVRGWAVAVGGMAHTWREDGTERSTAGAAVQLQALSRRGDQLVLAEAAWTGVYRRARLTGMVPLSGGRFSVRPHLSLGWGEGIPIQEQFPLDGVEGFPGLRVGERRGDREVSIGVASKLSVLAPMSVILDLAWGRSASGGALVDRGGWLVGARIGLGADTQFGPVSVEYGLNDRDRDLLVVRVGRWF